MEGLINGLTILAGYENPSYPTYCEHDVMYVCISPKKVTQQHLDELEQLGFEVDFNEDCFYSFKYGSC